MNDGIIAMLEHGQNGSNEAPCMCLCEKQELSSVVNQTARKGNFVAKTKVGNDKGTAIFTSWKTQKKTSIQLSQESHESKQC